MRQLKAGELVFDFDIYPRQAVDSQHVHYMRESAEAGAEFPPVVIDQKTKRIVDGFHRVRMTLGLYGPEHLMDVVEKRYASEADLLADSIRLNASHGRALTRFDRVHCLLLAEKLELSLDETAKALSTTVERLKEMRVERVGQMRIDKKPVAIALKRTISHMSGKVLNQAQVEANKKLSGMSAMFYVNQVVLLIEANLLDAGNEELWARLEHLGSLIRSLRRAA